jgi:hypothetical protein
VTPGCRLAQADSEQPPQLPTPRLELLREPARGARCGCYTTTPTAMFETRTLARGPWPVARSATRALPRLGPRGYGLKSGLNWAPSTCKWGRGGDRRPVLLTSSPVPGPVRVEGNVSRWLAFGGWCCTSAATRAVGRFFNSNGEGKRAVHRPQGSAQSPSPYRSPISAARIWESDPGAEPRARAQAGGARFALGPGVRAPVSPCPRRPEEPDLLWIPEPESKEEPDLLWPCLDPRVRVQGGVRATCFGPQSPSPRRSTICFGPESPTESDLARHLVRLDLGPPAENTYRNGRGERPGVRSGCPSDGIATRSDVRKSFGSPQS